MANQRKTCIDLFAGCGGLSLGLEQAGFHPVFVNELNVDAMASYLLNRAEIAPHLATPSFRCNDVKELVTKRGRIARLISDFRDVQGIRVADGDLDLLVGGPPCQGYSGIGHRRSYSVDKEQLPSNYLYQDMAWLINKLQPKIFLFENVRGLLNAKWTSEGMKGEIWEDVQASFKSIKGYKRVKSSLVYAKDYGVAQNRPRVLLVGVRDDVVIDAWEKSGSTVASGFLPAPTKPGPDLVDLLGDLVNPKYENGMDATTRYPSAPKNALQTELRTSRDGKVHGRGAGLSEHEYSTHSPRVLEKFKYMLAHGGEIHGDHKTKKFAQRLLPPRWSDEGPRITATSLPDDYVHYSQPRILTVREWARLQGFPDWYQFAGSRTTGGLRRAGNPQAGVFDRELPKYTQIGNAVPVPLARAVGEHFRKVLA